MTSCEEEGVTWKLLRSNFSSSALGGGCGKVDSSTRCGTHFLSLTAHAVKASTALSAYRSPHRICRVTTEPPQHHIAPYSPTQAMQSITTCSGCTA